MRDNLNKGAFKPLLIKMKNKNIIIKKGEYLGDIFPFLPTNTIIRKNITGIGATTLEIKCLRNSIIVLPNLPVIYQKSANHQNVIGVHGDTTILDIIYYLSDSNIAYKKILVTPESFHKVIEAFHNQNIAFKKHYFLLLDECDKLSKDYNYRPSIIYPLYLFFEFENKALISATAMKPSDPRFEKQNFEIINITPDYDIRRNINIYKSNNSIYALNYLIGKNARKRTYFIFCNSINMITHIIKSKGIEKESAVFCSESGKDKLANSGFYHVGHKINEDKFSTYNFLTSRFFSALDIHYDKDIEIIILSDPLIGEYTIIDPETDVIQIIGRFRIKESVKSITVIAVEDPNLISLSEHCCSVIIQGKKESYDTIKNFAETLPHEEKKEVVLELHNLLDYNLHINKDGSVNYFGLDNYIFKNRIKGLYKDIKKLKQAYEQLHISDTDKFFFNVINYSEINGKTDSASMQLYIVNEKKFKTVVNGIIDLLDSLKKENIYDITTFEETKSDYKRLHPDIITAYDVLDHKILRLVENKIELKKELLRYANKNIPTHFPFLKDLQVEFVIGEKLVKSEIVDRFKDCIKRHNLLIKPTIENLGKYVIMKRNKIKDKGWGYEIKGYFNNS